MLLRKMTNKQLLKVKIDELTQIKGHGTTLVTLYIPPNKQITDITSYLQNEYVESENIKSRYTRNAVLTSIQYAISIIKTYKNIPTNGLVIFTSEDIKECIEPPEPININMYKCDNHFHTEQLLEQIKEKDIFGIITIDENECTVALIKGANINILHKYASGVFGKHDMGGQSQARFQRIREEIIQGYMRRVGAHIKELYKDKGPPSFIIVAGPGMGKDRFIKETSFQKLMQVPIYTVDVGYTDEAGIREAVQRSKEILSQTKIVKENEIIEKFKGECLKDNGLAIYGLNEIINATNEGRVKTIIICEDKLDKNICEIAEKTKTEIITITKNTEQYTMLDKMFNGIGGMLRYKSPNSIKF